MNDPIQQALDALHFEKALQLIQENTILPETTRGIYASRALRATSRYNKALEQSAPLTDPEGQLETAKNLFAKGEITDSIDLLKTIHTPKAKLALAGALAETGNVHKACQLADSIDPASLTSLDQMDLLVLQADIASFQEKEDKAIALYRKAIDKADFLVPENWVPLRKMLLYQNLADTYEQAEDMTAAFTSYVDGLLCLRKQKRTDPDITDFSSYQIEFLVSLANFYSNWDHFRETRKYLHQARRLLEIRPPLQKDYYMARLAYISGLAAMNQNKEDEARDFLSQALTLQKQLVARHQDKPEHLARTAYYYASLVDDVEQKKELYSLAGPVFYQVCQKEPAFYDAGLAEMCNEIGRLEHDETLLEKAVAFYKQLNKRDPYDWFILANLVVARINLANVSSTCEEEEEALKKELTTLKQVRSPDLAMLVDAAYESVKPLRRWLAIFSQDLPSPYDA